MLALGRYFGADDDGRFPCPLPGDWHGGSAWIDTADEDRAREPRLFCCGGRWRSLGETRAALAYGTDSLRSNIELATWTRRLAHDIGAFVPLPVALPELPPAAHDAVRKAREGFALLVGLRWADGEHRPVAWSVRFAAAWCGLTHWAAAMATRVLIEAGVIVEVGRVGRVRLYLPGGEPA